MESRPAANHRQCVVQLRTGGWDAAAASFARLMSFLPSAPPTAIQVALAGLLQAREAWDPLRAADLLESELAPCFGVEAVPREPDAELIERGGRLLASGLAPQRELQLQLASLRAREAPGGILLMGASECPLARELSQRPEPSPLYLWEADPDTPARLRAKFEDAARDVIWLTGDEVPHCDPSALPGTWMHPALHGLERDLAWRVSAR